MKRFTRVFLTLSMMSALGAAMASPAHAAAPRICVNPHVAGLGDTGWVCNEAGGKTYAGTVGQNRAIEGMTISISGMGSFCADAHSRNLGWIGGADPSHDQCVGDGEYLFIGTRGQNRPMEALRVRIPNWLYVSGIAHMQNVGWGDWVSFHHIEIGSTGEARNLEAVALAPFRA
ncbi:hypothetical protein ACWDRR_09865 [Kitasatospora sp. NPDC003701]